MDTNMHCLLGTFLLLVLWNCTLSEDPGTGTIGESNCVAAPDRLVFGTSPATAYNDRLSRCSEHCSDEMYSYAAVRPYSAITTAVECYCGWDLPETTPVVCNYACPGAPEERCGGVASNGTVYAASVSDYLPLTDRFLLVADTVSKTINQVATNNRTGGVLFTDQSGIVAIDFDPGNRNDPNSEPRVYWTDTSDNSIKSALLNGSGLVTVLQLAQGSDPHGLAVDGISKLLFYSDSRLGTINVFRLEHNDHIPIVAGTGQVRNIRLDPVYRHLYWSDWDNGIIERASYDGSMRHVVLQLVDSLVTGLALDLQERFIYWTEGRHNKVMVADMADGSNQRTVYQHTSQAPAHYYGVAIDDQFVYFVDWYNKSIQRVEPDGLNWSRLTRANFELMQGVMLYDSNTYRRGPQSECTDKNGDCSHFCIPVAAGVTCACPEGQHLAADNRTCVGEQTGVGDSDLIWLEFDGANTAYIRGIEGNPRDYLVSQQVNTWSISHNSWHWTALDIHHKKKSLFLVDKLDRLVVEMSLNPEHTISVLHYGTSSEVNGIAVDWTTNNVYWTDGMYNWIMLCRPGSPDRTRILVRGNLEQPHGIAVLPQKGYLFWVDWGTQPKLERTTLAGEHRVTLVNTGIVKPTGLSIDYRTNRVFWVNQLSIESVKFDGTYRQTYAAFSSNNFVDITLQGNYLFVTDATMPQPQLWFYEMQPNSTLGIHLALPRKPYGIAMFHPERQPDVQSPCTNNTCQHFCVPTPANQSQCLCETGYSLDVTTGNCADNNTLEDSVYVYSLGTRLCVVTINAATSSLIQDPSICFFASTLYEFRGLDLNYASGDIYFSEVKQQVHTIRRASLKNYTDNEQIIYGTGVVDGLAVDWVYENLYWTDRSYRHISMARLDGSYRKVLYDSRPGIPAALALDPVMRYIYWIEYPANPTSNTVIYRGSLDGAPATSVVIAAQNENPSGLTIDFTRNQLLWIDSRTHGISYLDLSSNVRMAVPISIQTDAHFIPYDLTVMEDYLVVSFKNTSTHMSGIHVIERASGRPARNGIMHDGASFAPYDVITFDAHRQPFVYAPADSCAFDNGGCSQLCLQGSTSYRCACVDGMVLASDSRNCQPAHVLQDNFFLIADDYSHSIYQLDHSLTSSSVVMAAKYDRPIGVVYDMNETRLYWSEFDQGLIRRARIDGTAAQTITNYRADNSSVQRSRIDGLAFEPFSRLLYFTDMGRNLIGVKNPGGDYQKILILDDLDQPRAIVLDPRNGWMYFGHNQRIERADMDGINRRPILTDLGLPTGIALDVQNERLYWCDQRAEKIESSDLDGNNRHVIRQLPSTADPYSVALFGGDIYWTDWTSRGISRSSVDGHGAVSVLLANVLIGANDIMYFSKEDLNVPNTCVENNGGCSHFCIPTPNGQQCACPDDNRLGAVAPIDGLRCPQTHSCPLISVNHGYFTGICTGQLNAVCPFACNPGYVPTTTMHLICGAGLQWNMDHNSLCSDVRCPLLEVPPHAMVDIHCPPAAGVGTTCLHTCAANFTVVGGNVSRACAMIDGRPQWTGRPVVCSLNYATHPVPVEQNSGNINLALGIALAVILCVVIVIIAACVVARKRRRKHDEHSALDSSFSSVPISQGSPVDSATSYNAMTDCVDMNPCAAYDNPSYMRHDELNRPEDDQAEPLPQKSPAGCDENTAFENPMYPVAGGGRQEDLYEPLPLKHNESF